MMLALAAVVLLVTALLTLAGFRPVPPLARFRPTAQVAVRRFHGDPLRAQAAYRDAVRRAPGMRVVEDLPGVLYVDSRPSARILGGDFGVAVRFEFTGNDAGTAVETSARGKAFGVSSSTLTEIERTVRMRAKRVGLGEISSGRAVPST